MGHQYAWSYWETPAKAPAKLPSSSCYLIGQEPVLPSALQPWVCTHRHVLTEFRLAAPTFCSSNAHLDTMKTSELPLTSSCRLFPSLTSFWPGFAPLATTARHTALPEKLSMRSIVQICVCFSLTVLSWAFHTSWMRNDDF